jgi:GNAT superfamily N-acetyltransferase
MEPVTIRIVKVGDLPAIRALCEQWQVEKITRNYRADTEPELTLRLDDFFLVAELGGQVIAFIIAQIKPIAGDDIADGAFESGPQRYLEVQDLYVQQQHRNRGVGSALVAEMCSRAASRGVRCSMVYSANDDYVRTARFYEKCGFRMWHIFMTRET